MSILTMAILVRHLGRQLAAVLLALPGLLTHVALAHDPGLSNADLVLEGRRLSAVITFAIQDIEAIKALDSDRDAMVSEQELADGKTLLAPLSPKVLQVTAHQQPVFANQPPEIKYDENNNFSFHFVFTIPNQPITIRSGVLTSLPKGHRQFLRIQSPDGRTLVEKMLSAGNDTATLNLEAQQADHPSSDHQSSGPNTHTFADFLKLGIEHILIGFDHLLFLFALLVVTTHFWDAVKIVTFFTIAHTITLALATFDIITLPGSIVEPLIAATIVYVGLENLITHGAPKGRWLLTFVFGLIHGFGFAGVLKELGIASGEAGIALPLFSFNLGVEIGQVLVASLVFPALLWLRSRPSFASHWVPACSVLVMLMGGFWLLERTIL